MFDIIGDIHGHASALERLLIKLGYELRADGWQQAGRKVIFLGDFIEYEVQLDDGQSLIVNEYTKDTTVIHPVGERVHIRFDPASVSLYESEAGGVLAL